MEKNYITLVKGDGSEVKAEVVFTFNSPEFNKDYVVFIPEDFGGFSAASYYVNDENQGSLAPIETEEEWNLIQSMLDEFMSQQQSGCGGCGGCESCNGDCDCDDCDGECDGEGCTCEKNNH